MTRTLRVAATYAAITSLSILAGCSGSSDTSLTTTGGAHGELFDSPAGAATPDQLTGLWGGTVDRGSYLLDVRLRFSASDLTAAARCKWTDGTTLLAGAKGKARMSVKPDGDLSCFPLGTSSKTTCGEVETLESVADKQSLGEKWCGVSFTPQSYDYQMSGTKARLALGAESLDLVKISD